MFVRMAEFIFLAALCCSSVYAQRAAFSPADIARGKYLVSITGCNDCHTPGYPQAGGKVPVGQWLVGDKIGFKGPWGTTYPANLRLFFQRLSEADWVKWAKTTQTRPPMPWFALRDMNERDLKSMYRFVRSLGATGEPAPSYVPPGQEPDTPYFIFDPVMPQKR